MFTIEQILHLHPGTVDSDWRQHPYGGWIYKTALVYGNAQVYGNAWGKSPLYIQGSRHAVTNCERGSLSIGCLIHTFAEWKANFRAIGATNGYSKAEIAEYGRIIEFASKEGR